LKKKPARENPEFFPAHEKPENFLGNSQKKFLHFLKKKTTRIAGISGKAILYIRIFTK
jgi:hypothetical protein